MFFVRFLHNHSVLLMNPEVLCEEMDLCFVRKNLDKEVSKFVCYFSGFMNYLIWSFSEWL